MVSNFGTYDDLIKAFEIFKKYPHSGYVSAEHDEVYSGPDPAVVSDEDKAALEELGWNDYGDGCFHSFV